MRGPKVLEAKRELNKLLQSQHDIFDTTEFATKLILCNDSGLISKELVPECWKNYRLDDLLNQECFKKVSYCCF